MKTRIVYEDNDIIVINKPAGLATQTAKIGQQDVVSELKNYLKVPNPYLGIIHRLDQPVEGLLVFAKNKQAAVKLATQLNISDSTLHKQYYAVVCGKPSVPEGELVDYLIKTPEGMARVVAPTHKDAKKAVLQYRTIQQVTVEKDDLLLEDIHIDTGRFHQIRVQMAHAGMSLLGDRKYADTKTKECTDRLQIRTVSLCAYRLDFMHPTTGRRLHFEVTPESVGFRYFTFSNEI